MWGTPEQVLLTAAPDLVIDPVLDDEFHLIPAHARPETYADLKFQQVEDGLDHGEISLGTGETALPFDAERDQFVQVFHLAGQFLAIAGDKRNSGTLLEGGTPQATAAANADAWPKTVAFLQEALP